MKHSLVRNKQHVGKVHKVLVEGVSKKSEHDLYGRNTQNTVIVFQKKNTKAGQYVNVKVYECTSATLKGNPIGLA